MTDWQFGGASEQVDAQSLVKPPVLFLGITLVSALASLSATFLSSGIGYLVAVGASILGGVTSLQDQKRQGHPSYVTLNWFKPALRFVRYLVLAITLLHVARLAIVAAEGGGILF